MSEVNEVNKVGKRVMSTRTSPTDPIVVPTNPVWNPTDAEYYYNVGDRKEDGTPHTLRGVVMDEQGWIYGYRNMSSIRVDSANNTLVGRVSIGHRKFRAYTKSEPFYVVHEPGTIVRVEVLVLSGGISPASDIETDAQPEG